MSGLAKILQHEINSIAQVSKTLLNLIKTAKTSTKKEYYRKKLSENNQKAFEMLVALDRLQNNKKANNEHNKVD